MRNIKRALSLALASVMLLGMMVVGSSAAFADADKIVNKEAAAITAGLSKKILRFYLKAFKALLVLFLAGMALTFALVMIGEVLPALPEKMPQLYHVVEDLLIPYYENFFAVISKECSFTPPSL